MQPPSGGCVLKHTWKKELVSEFEQPPSGGCVLKPKLRLSISRQSLQPPSGGCVLKQTQQYLWITLYLQPPSGGCVLKPQIPELLEQKPKAAAFGRLCVETICCEVKFVFCGAAAFGRLCVETIRPILIKSDSECSRLRAAVC